MGIHILLIIFVIFKCAIGDKTVGFPEMVSEEYANAECVAENVPNWIQGTLVRYQCGAFGSPRGSGKRSISHFYDCLGMMNAFKFENGRVTFSSKYFDTHAYRVWIPTRRNADTVGQRDQLANDQSSIQKSDQIDASPLGSIWASDDRACQLNAVSDAPGVYKINLRNGQFGDLKLDNGQNAPDHTVLHHNPHPRTDKDGNLWGTVIAARNKSSISHEISRTIYKIDFKTKERKYFHDLLPTVSIDLSLCQDVGTGWIYPAGSAEDIGYISEISITQNYLILIENSYVLNPCVLLEKARATSTPFLATWFSWKNSHLKIHLVNKAEMKLKKTISFSPAVFVSQTINVVENDPLELGYIVIDVITHPNSDVLTKSYSIDQVMSSKNSWPSDASIKRYSIDPNTGNGAQSKIALPFGMSAEISAEFVAINEANRGDPSYNYAYLLMQPFSDGSSILKISIRDNRQPAPKWTAEAGVYPAGQAAFISRSGQSKEDDGVLLVPAFNSNSKKGLIIILDATNLTQIGRVEAPDLITYGTYTRFMQTCKNQAGSVWEFSVLKMLISMLLIMMIV